MVQFLCLLVYIFPKIRHFKIYRPDELSLHITGKASKQMSLRGSFICETVFLYQLLFLLLLSKINS